MKEYAKRISEMEEEVRKLKVLTDSLTSPDMVSFGGGAPGLEAYPMEILQELSHDIFQRTSDGYGTLKYGSAIGSQKLREVVKDILLAPRGLNADLKNIMITSGGIQPMNFVCQLLIDPGDTILVETPSFVHTSMIFKMFRANLVSVKTENDGMDMADLEEKIKKYRPKFIYVVPTFQNPTGVTWSIEKRKILIDLANKYDTVILEDDPYREIRYSGETLPYIKSFDTQERVILANSFSKIFAPGSRLGYIVAKEEYIDKFCNIKLGTDTCTCGIAQELAAEFFKRGYYPDHLKSLCNLYRSRRDAMLQALDEYFPDGTKHTMPDGGYYVWVELPENLNATKLAPEVGKELNICYGIGSIFYTDDNPAGSGDRCMRMNFSGLTEEVIDTNLKKLGDFFKSKM